MADIRPRVAGLVFRLSGDVSHRDVGAAGHHYRTTVASHSIEEDQIVQFFCSVHATLPSFQRLALQLVS